MEKENQYLEYKEDLTKSYLKTVSAFANYHDGEIIFGVSDDLKIIGFKDQTKEALNIENQINDSIKPKPEFLIKKNVDKTITLFVKKGLNTPYRYNGKCFIRNDTSTIECNALDENRLVLEGLNKTFEEIKSKKQDLTFNTLKRNLEEKIGLANFSIDTLKTLSLYNENEGYNNAASLLADNNCFYGIDIVIFGDNFNEIKKRFTLKNISILDQYEKALEIFKDEYIVERISGGYREKYEKVPLESFREALANAIIHRSYDINANSKIEMYKDKIIISSVGMLPKDLGIDDFLEGSYSSLKNPIIANVFHRLNIIEAFATGIRRINKIYESLLVKPTLEVRTNSVVVTLPLKDSIVLTFQENKVYSSMSSNFIYSRNDIEEISKINKDTLIKILNSLIDKNLLIKEGKGKNTCYHKK